jgi:hypothetical protein
VIDFKSAGKWFGGVTKKMQTIDVSIPKNEMLHMMKKPTHVGTGQI